jgi:hypothetical protein
VIFVTTVAWSLFLLFFCQTGKKPTHRPRARPRNPPSRLPRAFAAARAARVRPEIIFASCSAMAAMMWIVRRFAWGKSTASNSTFDSIKLEMKATLRARRSSLAMISLAP